MSRIGKQPIIIPSNVNITLTDKDIIVKGPKGELTQALHKLVKIEKTDSEIIVKVGDPEEKNQRALWGLYRRLINNMVIGVTDGYSRQLEVNGVGFKAVMVGKVLNLALGFSHPINFDPPKGIEISVEKNIITISGFDKQLVGQTAADVRAFKKPEPYKGKGIKYTDEVIRRKAGKTATKGA